MQQHKKMEKEKMLSKSLQLSDSEQDGDKKKKRTKVCRLIDFWADNEGINYWYICCRPIQRLSPQFVRAAGMAAAAGWTNP
jgi:hypothetical protein